MATPVYVDSSAVGANNGTTKADAYTSLKTAINNYAYTQEILVSHTHSQNITATDTWSITTQDRSKRLIAKSINFSTDVYTPGATILLNTAAVNFVLNFTGVLCGIKIHHTAGANLFYTATGQSIIYYDCPLGGTASSSVLQPSGSPAEGDFVNCDFTIFNTAFSPASTTKITGGSFSGTAATTRLFFFNSNLNTSLVVNDCDFSGLIMPVNSNFVENNNWQTTVSLAYFSGCKMPANWIPSKKVDNGFLPTSTMYVGCENGTLESTSSFYSYQATGDVVYSTGVYRDTGYKDTLSGNSSVSHAMSPYSRCGIYDPLEGMTVVIPQTTTGTITITMEIAHNFSSSLKDTDFGLEISYYNTAGSPQRKTEWTMPTVGGAYRDPSAAGTALTTSTETWSGASGFTKQKISKTITINKKGILQVKPLLFLYEAGKLCYYDPKVKVA